MLTIRQEQLDAVIAARWDDFFRRALAQLRATRAERLATISDADARRVFDGAVERAHRHGMRTEAEVHCVFEATILLGERFEQDPANDWAVEILRSRHLAPEQRAMLLLCTAESMDPPPQPATTQSAIPEPDATVRLSPQPPVEPDATVRHAGRSRADG